MTMACYGKCGMVSVEVCVVWWCCGGCYDGMLW